MSCWVLGAAGVGYLGLKGGGYDALVHSQVGIAVWWIILIGACVGAVPAARLSRAGWVGIALLTAFAAWSAVSVGWSVSPERALSESARTVLYVGLVCLALAGATTPDRIRLLIGGVATGIVVIAGVAVAARVDPGSFSRPDLALSALPADRNRLAYPLNYWNGLAALCAVGLPLLFALTRSARTLIAQAAAAAAIPLLVVVIYLTESRGGAAAAILAVIAFLVLTGDRLAAFATGVISAGGSALLVGATVQRDDLLHAGTRSSITALLIVVCLGTGLLQLALSLAVRYVPRPAIVRPSPARVVAMTVGVALIAVVVAVAVGVPGTLSDKWSQFKQPPAHTSAERKSEDLFGRLGSSAGRGRYQMWQVAGRAFSDKPITGQGAGSFELEWAQHRDIDSSFVRNAHSLYLETLADLGLVGFALLIGLFLVMLVRGAAGLARRRALDRPLTAAAIAGLVGFCASAAVDWVWQIPVVAGSALLVGATLLAPYRSKRSEVRVPSRGGRVALGGAAVAALCVLAVAVTGTSALRSSQASARQGNLVAAAKSARTAIDAQPFAASPRLQLALVLERARLYDLAASSARKAVAKEPRNWKNWYVASRIEAERGRSNAAVSDYRRAKSLNPRSAVFTNG